MAEDDDDEGHKKAVKETLANPWNFVSSDLFYIYYDYLVSVIGDVREVTILKALGLDAQASQTFDEALTALKTMRFLARQAGVHLEKGALYPKEEHIPADMREWGRLRAEIISNDPLLLQKWMYRLQMLLVQIKRDAVFCASVEVDVLKAPEDRKALHLDKCKADSEGANHTYKILNDLLTKINVKYWEQGQLVPNMELEVHRAIEAYEKDHKDELRFLEQRYKAIRDRLKQHIEEAGFDAEAPAKLSLPDLLMQFLKGANCGDPNCPVHGHLNKNDKSNNTRESSAPALKALPAPAGNTQAKEESVTMAPNTLTPSKKNDKNNKDEIKFSNVSVQFVNDPNSKHIILPDGMTLKEGRHWLQKIEDEETRIFVFEYKFKNWFPLDAMWSTYRALSELHGFVHIADFQSWFGPTPPTMMTIDIDYGNTQQIPWGPIEVSALSQPLVPSIELEQGLPTLVFHAKIRHNERAIADKLMKRTEEMLRSGSIYRGRAIEVDFTMFPPNDFRFDPTKAPRFWDCSRVSPDNLILPDDVQAELNTSLWGPIRKTAQARKHGIPLRRGVLIDGSYGVGKTLAARVTAKLCQDNGWTFLYLKHLDQLEQALYFAKKYEPCVIFAEDVNRIVNGERDADMDKLFNVMDGVDRKDDEVMVVFTTNNIEEIHAGMLRPGRIDSVIKVTPPDAVAARKLVRLYGRDTLDQTATLEEVGNLLNGQIPAIIREAVERAKLAAILDTEDNDPVVVKDSHLVTAAKQMLLHAELLKTPPEPKPDLQVLGESFGEILVAGLRKTYSYGNDHSDAEVKKSGLRNLVDEAGRPDAKTNGQPEA